ncbi:MAG TPA: GNAT family N-acetyltransferase [Pyrinomonadaceae bacterium]
MIATLETERLILREWTPADAGVIYEICSDPEVMRHIGDGSRWETFERARLWMGRVRAAYREQGFGRYAVVEKESGRVVGSCGFGKANGPAGVDFGYVFARSVWGRGYATEAGRACLRYGFEQVGFAEVVADTDIENHASRRVLEKLGFEFRGLKRNEGDDVDSTFYVARNPSLPQRPD